MAMSNGDNIQRLFGRMDDTKYTPFMWEAQMNHTSSLRQRFEKGWTPGLQRRFNTILRQLDSQGRSHTSKEDKELNELSEKGCWAEDLEPLAYYSTYCCFWTDRPDDLGSLPGTHDLPCCPSCGAVLLQAPLLDFIHNAYQNPLHYAGSIDNFWRARGSGKCFKIWEDYIC